MTLSPGTLIGLYEVLAPLGAGGMGEVYKARDTRLDRDVAIKILPEIFVRDPDRLSRFEREAKTLASLNHTNIAQIHGVVELPPEAGAPAGVTVRGLVMEFVDGEDLAQRLLRGALPLDEALHIARQVADALQAAHERGVVHRDLKPANVKVRPDATAKVLDFGLAKDVETNGGSPVTHSAVTSPAMTAMGVILGTAAYMSPEQAKGKPVDRGSDMWSFGALLFEMLAGRPAFAGETITDVLAAIITRDPDWSLLPAATPPAITRLLRRCLERERRRRLADAGEARFQIEEVLATPAAATEIDRRAVAVFGGRAWIPWVLAAFTTVAALAMFAMTWRQPAQGTARYNLDLPPKATLSLLLRPAVTISPDGRTIVYVASVAGIDRLYMRRTDVFESVAIQGTEGASTPVISPNGQMVAFTTLTHVWKVPIGAGPVVKLAEIADGRGLSWTDDETIIYTPYVGGGVWSVPAAGGSPVQLTALASSAERTHRWPQSLPGGALLFTVGDANSPDSYDNAMIAAQMPDGSRRTVLTAASMARYVPTGHLIFARGQTLFTVPFDPQRAEVTGSPTAVLHDVAGDVTTGAAHFAIAASGTLVYVAAGDAQGSLLPVWVDRSGRPDTVTVPAGVYSDLRLSPDGQQAALTAIAGGGRDVWLHHFRRGTFTRMTFAGQNVTPLWSHDGSTLYYSAANSAGGTVTIMRRPADGSRAAEAIVTVPGQAQINDIAPDGRSLIVNIVGTGGANRGHARLTSLSLKKEARPVSLVDGAFDVFTGRVSPDGRWLAYASWESGRPEVYVRPLAGGSGRWAVSTGGGEEPKWSADGRRLYYRANDVLMGVSVVSGSAAFEFAQPQQVLAGLSTPRTESGLTYEVDPKAERFLMLRPGSENATAQSLRLIVTSAKD